MNTGILPFDIVELNTMSNPIPRYRDETPRVRCKQCGNLFLYGHGMIDYMGHQGARIRALTDKHFAVCQGDAAVALMKVEQAWKAGWRPA